MTEDESAHLDHRHHHVGPQRFPDAPQVERGHHGQEPDGDGHRRQVDQLRQVVPRERQRQRRGGHRAGRQHAEADQERHQRPTEGALDEHRGPPAFGNRVTSSA